MNSDETKKPADLVLEGGGVKGIGLVGAVSVLEEHGYSFRRIAGTSAGAVVGAFVAAGCSSEDLTRRMQSIDYRKFRDHTALSRLGPPGKVLSLLISNGLYRGDYIEKWVAEQLEACGIKTFADLKITGPLAEQLPENERYKLVVVTADLSKGELVYLPWDYHKYGLNPDNQSVASAIRASISIPYFYKPYHIERSTLVDGGVLSNFPVGIFDTSPDWPTFGVKLSSKERATQIPRKVTGPLSLASALFSTMMQGHDQRHLSDPCTQERTIFIDTDRIEATDFDITKEQQDHLFDTGQKSARRFLEAWDFEHYKSICQ